MFGAVLFIDFLIRVTERHFYCQILSNSLGANVVNFWSSSWKQGI